MPPETSAQTVPVQPVAPKKPGAARFIIIGAVLVAVVVLGYFGHKFLQYSNAVSKLPAPGESVLFFEQGVPEYYQVESEVLVRHVPEAREDGAAIYEEGTSAAVEGESIVLGTAPGVLGTFFGTMSEDGETINVLVAGRTYKSDLQVSEDGTAIFAVTPYVEVVESTNEEEAGESAEEETGSATGPVETEVVAQVESEIPSRLIAVDVSTGSIRELGAGRSPRLIDGGVVRAIVAGGVVDIDLATGTRTLVLEQETGDAGGALSASGEVAALLRADGSALEFYRIDEEGVMSLGFLEKNGDMSRVTFVGEDRVLIRSNIDLARLYQLPTDKMPIALPIALIAVTQ